MGFVGQAIGSLAGGIAGGSGIGKANITNPTDPNQIAQAYKDQQQALANQQALMQTLQAQGGIQNQTNVFQQQQALANQLGQIGAGQGPNPAQAQLAQATGQNVANQAALMAGQRGTSANAGLLARQAAQQGGALQQQAVGQGATLQAQQQLAALQAQQAQQAQMAQLAGAQVGQQQGAANAYQQGALAGQSNLLGAAQGYNQAQVSNQGLYNQALGQITGGMFQGLGAAAGGLGGLFKAAPAAAGAGATSGIVGAGAGGGAGSSGFLGVNKAYGGEIEKYADGGMVGGPKSFVGQHLAQSMKMAKGGVIDGEQLAAQGMTVPGKAVVKGDSLKNDKVPARLSPGEIVIPRSIAQHPQAPSKAAEFVKAIMAKKGLR
jgi:hypothetical protein